MDKFEEKLASLRMLSIQLPDPEQFVERLHGVMAKREAGRQRAMTGLVAIAIALATTFGLIRNSNLDESTIYAEEAEFLFFSDLEEEELGDSEVEVDADFVYEVVDLLILEADLVGTDWGILEELDGLGLIDLDSRYLSEEES